MGVWGNIASTLVVVVLLVVNITTGPYIPYLFWLIIVLIFLLFRTNFDKVDWKVNGELYILMHSSHSTTLVTSAKLV